MMHTTTVRSHEIWLSGTPLFCRSVAGSALTPALALDYLGELSTDIEDILVLDREGRVAAATGDDDERSERMRELFAAPLARPPPAFPAAGDDHHRAPPPEAGGSGVRASAWSSGGVASRKPLSSLM